MAIGSVGPKVAVNITGYELSEKRRRELLPVEREGTIDYSAIEEGRRRISNPTSATTLPHTPTAYAAVTHAGMTG